MFHVPDFKTKNKLQNTINLLETLKISLWNKISSFTCTLTILWNIYVEMPKNTHVGNKNTCKNYNTYKLSC